MAVTIVGDFADPLSFLASQRAEQIRSLGLHAVRWLAVEADRTRPMAGRPLDAATLDRVRRLSLPGEALPPAGLAVPNSRAATAAYAEALTDGAPDAMRRALFDALWVHGRAVGDPDVIRSVAFTVLGPGLPAGDLEAGARAVRLLVPLGDSDTAALTRRLGFMVSASRGPLTRTGQQRVDAWRRLWQQRGAPQLPLLLTELGEAFAGERALDWLAERLPQRDPARAIAAVNAPMALPREPATMR